MSSSNSSDIAPVGVGNTETPTPRQGTCKCVWFVTLNVQDWNSSNSSNLKAWIQNNCRDATWQVERGASGNLHVQLTMRLKLKQRLTWLKRHFSRIAHCEVSANVDASYDYCMKSDTRVEGPYAYPEPLEEECIDDPLAGLTLYPWQQRIVDIITGPVDNRKIYWFWEPDGNAGKSDFALHCILKHNAVVYDSGKKDILYAHNKQKIVFFDLSRTVEGFVSYDALEQLKKGFCFSGKYESGMKVYPKPHIIVFANFEPNYRMLSADRWDVFRIPR